MRYVAPKYPPIRKSSVPSDAVSNLWVIMSFPITCIHVLSGSNAVESESFVTDNVVSPGLQTSANSCVEPSKILITEPVPIKVCKPSPAKSPSWKNKVEVPVKSEIRLFIRIEVFVVNRMAVVSNPIVPTKVLEFASVSTIGMETQRVPSGEISTVLFTPSSVATNEEVIAEHRNESALDELPFTSGIVLTDSVPRLKVELPAESEF